MLKKTKQKNKQKTHTHKIFNAEKKINENLRGKLHVFTLMLYNEHFIFPLFFLIRLDFFAYIIFLLLDA